MSVSLSVILSLRFCICLCFVPHLVNQHIDNLFSLWAASIGKHIASLAARHCALFFLVYISLSHCAHLIID